MTDTELIAQQAKENAELRNAVERMQAAIRKAAARINGIGGPLNDNKLEFNFDQRNVFHQIIADLDVLPPSVYEC